MLFNSLTSASALVFCLATATATAASAQSQVQAVKMLGPVRDAGIYHVATGTWTRNSGPQASLGPDVVYRNDATSGYFGTGWESTEGIDEGMLPGTGHPAVGSQDTYVINGLKFSYCALGAGPGITWDLTLYDSYVPCSTPGGSPPCINLVWTMSTGVLPRNSACWVVTFDLTGGAEACMEADGGPCAPGYQGAGLDLDHFGFGQTWFNNSLSAGPILSGDPTWSPRGEGTCYSTTLTCAAGATGLGERDVLGLGWPPTGCLWFGGYKNKNGCGGPSKRPSASVDHSLYTDCTVTAACGVPCETISCDEAQDPNNTADIGVDDCVASSDSQLIVGLSNAPADRFSYLLLSVNSGAVQNPPGAVGTLCVSGQIAGYVRDVFKTDANGAGSMDVMNAITGGGGGNIPVIGGNLVGGTWNAQYWFRVSAGVSGFSSLTTFGPVQ